MGLWRVGAGFLVSQRKGSGWPETDGGPGEARQGEPRAWESLREGEAAGWA